MRTSLFSAAIAACAISIAASPLAAQQRAAAQRPAGTSVAVIDISQVFKNHQRFKAQMEDIKKDIQAFENFVRQEQKKMAGLGEQLKTFNAGSPEYKQKETEIANLQADLQVQMQLKKKEFLEAEAQVYYSAYTEVVDHVSQFAERYGIGLVLRFNGEPIDPQKRESVLQGVNRAVVFQRSLNITSHIIDAINRGNPPPNVSNTNQIPINR